MQYNVARSLVGAAGRGKGEGFFSATDLAAMQPRIRAWQDDSRYHVVKTHDACEWLLGTPRHTRVCYVHRDLRDVAASFRRKWPQRELMPALGRAVEVFHSLSSAPGVLVQRYEDYRRRPAAAATELARHLGLEATADAIGDAVEASSLARAVAETASLRRTPRSWLHRLAVRLGWDRDRHDPETLLHDNHISATAGATGVWREVLTAAESAEIERRFGDWLRLAGYLPEPEERVDA
jgi:hypothetical protein